jgi:hypothetical protein
MSSEAIGLIAIGSASSSTLRYANQRLQRMRDHGPRVKFELRVTRHHVCVRFSSVPATPATPPEGDGTTQETGA